MLYLIDFPLTKLYFQFCNFIVEKHTNENYAFREF